MSRHINPELLLQIEKHEGRRKTPYTDSEGGNLTIGIGHLVMKPLHDDVIEFIFMYDVQEAVESIRKKQPWIFEMRMSQTRRNAFVEMVFNLGITRFGKFRKMIKAAKEKDWQRAHDEALDSLWARQVKGRAKTLAKQILNG